MGKVFREVRKIQKGSVGVESAHSFGDTLFNIPLIKALYEKYNRKIIVATRHNYTDGFINIPYIDKIVTVSEMGQGAELLRNMGVDHVFQITQNITFLQLIEKYPGLSLIDSPLYTGREIGLDDFDQKPIFTPTTEEIQRTASITNDQPTIAIESEARSGQSWATGEHIDKIIDKYESTHRILWLSNTKPPNRNNIYPMDSYTRREAIMCLKAADIFYSVGSGFFCAAMALEQKYQPRHIVCLWRDDFYRYKNRITELNFHKSISWIENEQQLVENLR